MTAASPIHALCARITRGKPASERRDCVQALEEIASHVVVDMLCDGKITREMAQAALHRLGLYEYPGSST